MAACSNAAEAAENTLGSRITWKGGIRHLDGTYCDLDRMMREANRARKDDGLPQLGTKREWRW